MTVSVETMLVLDANYIQLGCFETVSSGAQRHIRTPHKLTGLSTRIASHQGAILLFGRMIWVGGVVVIAASVLILILDDDVLEKWCVKSCFSRTDGKRFGNNGEALSELFNAIQGVL